MAVVNQSRVGVKSGDALDVRTFQITQAMSRLFRVEVEVVSHNPDIDFDEVIGNDAHFSLSSGASSHTWRGVCVDMEQIRVDRENLATYTLSIAPRAYLLTQRKNYRIFQYKSEIEIVQQILGEWGVPHRAEIDPAAHLARKFRVQYGESDFDFVSRMLEDAGISFYFEDADDETTMVLADEPQAREVSHANLHFHDEPGTTDVRFVTAVALTQRTRPSKNTIGDLEYRRPSTQQPRLSANRGLAQEAPLERFDYEPGVFLFTAPKGGNTPAADDRGTARTDEGTGSRRTENRLLGRRQDAVRVALESNVLALTPGTTLSVFAHPHPSVSKGALLVTSAAIAGGHDDDWRVECQCAPTDVPFRPDFAAPRPRVPGLESAAVVGPGDDEIHTDEYGRVRVHFHWDRESQRDEKSSCWLPVNQPWAGAGFGGVSLPRVGQEVLVEFLGGDPDRPMVIGRVFTKSNKPAYPMPQGMKVTGIIGKSSPAMITGAADSMPTSDFVNTFSGSDPNPAFSAQPPKPVSTSVSDNAFLLGDSQGEDITFIQAKRDMNWLAKNKWTTVIGNYRGQFIGGDDMLKVRNKQRIDVVENQELRVVGSQYCEVGKLRDERVDKTLALSAKGDIGVQTSGTAVYKGSKYVIVQSEEAVVLKVEDSTITITEAEIVIQSAKVDINPDS